MMAPAILDLFAGAGGMALGFEAVGARCVGAVEIDLPASRTFKRTFPEAMVFGGPANGSDPGGDMTRIPIHTLVKLEPDIVVGGPPCQGFSRIGRAKQRSLLEEAERIRQGALDPARDALYAYFMRVVVEARPKAFVMENVPGMRDHLGTDVAARIAAHGESCGYNVRYFLLNAAWYGVPQSRWRLFFVGYRDDLAHDAIPGPPLRTHSTREDYPEGVALPSDDRMVAGPAIPAREPALLGVTTREALDDLPRLACHLRGERPGDIALPLRREPSAWVTALRAWPGRPAPKLVTGNWYRWTPRDFRIFERMAHGDRYPQARAIAESLFRERYAEMGPEAPEPGSPGYRALRAEFIPPYRNDAFDDKWAKLDPRLPSWTLTAHLSRDSYSHIHYDSNQARTITIREAARLQSFPDSIEFQGNHGDQLRQIGNAVPPLLARALAETVIAQLAEIERRRTRRTETQRVSV